MAVDTAVVVVPQVLTPGQCQRIIDRNRPQVEPTVPRDGGMVQAHPIEDLAYLCGSDMALYGLFHQLNRDLGWGIEFDIVRFGVSCYQVGDWMSAHVDDEERGDPPWDVPHRGISFSVQLSAQSSYEGGRLRVRVDEDADEWAEASALQGDLVAFGSSTRHEVTAVTAGERWVLLAWAYTNHHLRGTR